KAIQRNAFIGGFALVLLFAFFIFRSYKQKQKAHNEIVHQKEIIQEKNKEITDSIQYAKHLKNAILPPISFVKKHLPDSFIYYKPKDIVAGDFYWMEFLNDSIYIAAADCTGHGVPGAMVSVVCSNALNRAVKEFKLTAPNKILDKVRELVVETFVRNDSFGEKSENEVKDGMDISLCCINNTNKHLIWAGANNPLWIIRDKQLIEYKADKQPIGKTDNPTPFTCNETQLLKNDSLYLFTDGYADQFGGPKGKKFKYKQMQNLLLSCNSKPMNEQNEIIGKSFEEWKGNLEQVDDILIIGIKI
ncbi:MAG TPA: SpoIIE family protein phosphatase, partial [Bacteroidia bacterium]|nr:SpoIIE family protein phosphatase [Bacteroidia bacterium]